MRKINISGLLKKRINIAILFFFFPLNVFPCEQVEDILIWKGDTLTLFSNPLESIVDYALLRESIIQEIERISYKNIRDYEQKPSSYSTACGKGYQAEWILMNDSIFLNNIYHCHNKNVKVALNDIFTRYKENEKIFASWINGDLVLQQGECIKSKQLSYHSVYEMETTLSVENGLLSNIKVYNNNIAKRSVFFENVKPGEVFKFTHKQINWCNLPDLENKLIIVYLSVNLDENGVIESLNDEDTYYEESYLNKKTQKIDSSKFVLDADINNPFINESFRIAKLIPEWDVIYHRGKVLGSGLIMEFSEKQRKQNKK